MATASFNVPQQLSLYGNLQENWRKFKQAFNIYMIATALNKESKERQVAIFLNLVGQEGVKLFNTLTLKDDEKKDIDKVLEAIEKYCEPKKNILHCRYLFYTREQKEKEDFDSFFMDVKILAENCEFKDAEEMLRDKIVLYGNDLETKEKNIKMGTITLKDAVEYFRMNEITKKQTKEMVQHKTDVINCQKPLLLKSNEKDLQKGSSKDEFGGVHFQPGNHSYSRQYRQFHHGNVKDKQKTQNNGNIRSCSRCGLVHPSKFVADNMPFNSLEFRDFGKTWQFEIITSSPYYPKSNGLAEKAVGICKKLLKKSFESKTEIEIMLLEYRNTPVVGTKYSPSQLLFSRRTKTKLPISSKLLEPKVVQNFSEKLEQIALKNKRYYDQNAKRYERSHNEGDNIVYWRDGKWEPAVVLKNHSTPRSVLIRDQANRVKRRNYYDIRKSYNVPKITYNNSGYSSGNFSDTTEFINTPLLDNHLNHSSSSDSTENTVDSQHDSSYDTPSTSMYYKTKSGRISKPPDRF